MSVDASASAPTPPNPRPCDECGEPAVFTDPGEWGGDVYLCRKHTRP